MANSAFTENFGKIARLFPHEERTYFRLTGGRTAMNPTVYKVLGDLVRTF